jgi:hypothetical protein
MGARETNFIRHSGIRHSQVTPTGLERGSVSTNPTNDLRDPQESSAAKSGAVLADSGPVDADLAAVVNAWQALAVEDQQRIVAIARKG